MSRMLGRENAHLRIGHNGGPPLDVGYHAWVWRRAHARAWKNPGREIVMLRLRQAERLGLDYRTYTSVLMDRGSRLETMLLMVGEELLPYEPEVLHKLARFPDSSLIFCVPAQFRNVPEQFLSRERAMVFCPDSIEPMSLARILRDYLRNNAIAPASVFMVGTESRHRLVSERAGLGAFADMRSYFGSARV